VPRTCVARCPAARKSYGIRRRRPIVINPQLESGAWLVVHLEGAANFGMPPAERATSKKKKEAQQIWQGGLPGGPTWPSSALSARTRSGKPKSATAPLEADQQRLRRLVEREGAVVDIVAAAVDAGMYPQAVHVELLIT